MINNERLQYFASFPGNNLSNPHHLILINLRTIFVRCAQFQDDERFVKEWFNFTKIELKDFDKMPDYEAIEILQNSYTGNITIAKAEGEYFYFKMGCTDFKIYLYENQLLVDEVRKRGYATRWRNYEVEQLVKMKWLILK